MISYGLWVTALVAMALLLRAVGLIKISYPWLVGSLVLFTIYVSAVVGGNSLSRLTLTSASWVGTGKEKLSP